MDAIKFMPHQLVAFAHILDRIADVSGLMTRSEREIFKQEVASFLYDCVPFVNRHVNPFDKTHVNSEASDVYYLAKKLESTIEHIIFDGNCTLYEENNHEVAVCLYKDGYFGTFTIEESKEMNVPCLEIIRGQFYKTRRK